MPSPKWAKYPLRSPFSDGSKMSARAGGVRIPTGWLSYSAAEEQAYCRAWGIAWYPRTTPEVRKSAPHPRSAYRELPL